MYRGIYTCTGGLSAKEDALLIDVLEALMPNLERLALPFVATRRTLQIVADRQGFVFAIFSQNTSYHPTLPKIVGVRRPSLEKISAFVSMGFLGPKRTEFQRSLLKKNCITCPLI